MRFAVWHLLYYELNCHPAWLMSTIRCAINVGSPSFITSATKLISNSIHNAVEVFRVQDQALDEVEVGMEFLDTKDTVWAIKLKKAVQYI